ncbi:MAG: histidinol-phosphatase [Clostridia bacterium]|nr:histidinol-phosphatase [Clostridia bacterium]
MSFLYETHLHTCQGSACGVTPGREYPKRFQDLGYDGIFVTDHFFQGNCAAPRTGRWADRVDAYMAGYYDALEAGEKIGFKVFFGIEQNYRGDEYLLYGIDREFLLAHEDMERWPRERLFDEVRAWGGCAVQAHPFRERGYITKIHLQLRGLDAIEGVNTGNKPHEDALALKYAAFLGLPVTGGSDIHNVQTATAERLCAVEFDEPLLSGADYARRLRCGKAPAIRYPVGRLEGVWPQLPATPWEAGTTDEIDTRFKLEDIINDLEEKKHDA